MFHETPHVFADLGVPVEGEAVEGFVRRESAGVRRDHHFLGCRLLPRSTATLLSRRAATQKQATTLKVQVTSMSTDELVHGRLRVKEEPMHSPSKREVCCATEWDCLWSWLRSKELIQTRSRPSLRGGKDSSANFLSDFSSWQLWGNIPIL